MDFLKLSTTTFEDPKVKILRSKFGRDGYLVYIHTLYLICQGLTTKNNECVLPYAAETLSFDLGIEKETVKEIYILCIELELLEGDPENEIQCTKILTRLEKNKLSPAMRKLVKSVEQPVTPLENNSYQEFPKTQENTPALKGFAEEVYKIWESAKLPCKRGGLSSFLQSDMRNALAEMRQQNLTTDEVLQACKNYVEIIQSNNSWYTARLPFDNFMKETTIKRFLPDYYKKEYFVNSNGNSGVNKSGADQCNEVGF
jgi:hypothetical protein